MIVRPIDYPRDAAALKAFLDEQDSARLDLTEAAVRDNDAFIYVVDDGGAARGLCIVQLNYRDDQSWIPTGDTVAFQQGENAYLENLHVDAPLRGRGLGARLLAAAEEQARRHGKRCLWLHCRETNVRALAFYERHGWTHERTVIEPWLPDIPMRIYKRAL